MSMDKSILHITLNTGHARRSYRSEVGDDIIPQMHMLLARMLAGERARIPGVPDDMYLSGKADGAGLIATISANGQQGARPIVTMGVSGQTDNTVHLWQSLHSDTQQPLITDPADVPPAPWCAARIEPAASSFVTALLWIGDLERCLAWAWLERQ